MSLFSAPKLTNTFNSSDIAGNGDIQTISINLGDYVTKSTPVMTNDLYLKENVGINFFGKKQDTAYTEIDRIKLNDSADAIIAIKNNNNVTTIDDTLDLTQTTVLLANESVEINKIIGLTNKLTEIDANLVSINDNDNDIAELENIIIQHSSDIDNMKNMDLSHNSLLSEHTTDILANTANITTNANNINIHDISLSDHDVSINDLQNNLTIKSNEIANLVSEDVTIHNEINTNLTSLNSYKSSNDTSITNINSTLTNHTINLVNIESDIVAVQVKDIGQDSDILALQNTTVSHELMLNELTLKNTSQDTSLNVVFSDTLTNTINITSIQGLTTSNLNRLSTLETDSTAQATNITNIEADLLTKNLIINNNNKLNVSFLGNGDVSNAKLSALNNIRTDISIQTQLDTITDNLTVLDGLQDMDLLSIPVLQTSVTEHNIKLIGIDNDLLLKQDIISDTNKINISNVDNLIDQLSDISTNTANQQLQITTNNTNYNTLANVDLIHNLKFTELENKDLLLQTNIDLKQNLISVSNKLNSSVIFDSTNNDTLNNIIDVIDNNISALTLNKQNKVTSSAKLDSSLLDLTTTPLQYVDITSNLKAQLLNITNSISTLQGLQNSDITSFATIEANFDTIDLLKLNKSVYDDTIAPEILSINSAISTLQGLQSGDIISFDSVNASLTNLQNTKQPLINTNNKLNSSLLNRDDNLQYVDVSESINTLINNLQSGINLKNDIIDTNNKLLIANVNLSGHSLSHVDIDESLSTSLANMNTTINTLTNTDISQTILNNQYTAELTSHSTSLTTLQNYDNAQTVINANLQTNIDNIDFSGITTNANAIITLQTNIDNIDLSGITTNANSIVTLQTNIDNIDLSGITTNANAIVTLQTNIDNIDLSGITTNANAIITLQTNIDNIDLSGIATNANAIVTLQTNIDNVKTKIEPYGTPNYNDSINKITHTYDETNLFIDPLDDNNLLQFDLSINNVENNKNYKQVVVVNCLQFKSYINVLKINGDVVELKFKNGDNSINLAPISGYSMLNQNFNITRVINEWYVMSDIDLFYNSASNTAFDNIPPVIILTESANVDHEINTTYNDAGATANDNIYGDISSDIVTVNNVNIAVLGSYTITYNVVDAKNNVALEVIRIVNVIDTTNPVVTLTGLNEVTYNSDAYVEEGATATDNSNEILVVVIGGNLNQSISGSYNVTYTATDSTGNVHTIGRLVHILAPEPVLVYSNPSVNIFDHVGFESGLSSADTTLKNFTISGNATNYINGDYHLAVATYNSNTKPIDLIELVLNRAMYGMGQGHANICYSHIYGPISLSSRHPYNPFYIGFNATHYTDGVSDGIIPIYFDHYCDSNATTYAGDFVEWSFPFLVKPSALELKTSFAPQESILLGSNDGGVTWNFISQIFINGGAYNPPYTKAISTTSKYSHFKWIMTKSSTTWVNLMLHRIAIFGDIYK